MGTIFKVMKSFGKIQSLSPDLSDEEKGQKMLELIDPESFKDIETLVIETLKTSYPDKKEETLNAFGTCHLWELLPEILELNSFTPSHENLKKAEILANAQGKNTKT
jgi:hypothetical protein